MLISVIVPVYNVEKYIEACLESIIKSGLDCEVIMVDDGSIDSSYDICEKYVKKQDNFFLFRNEGKGLSDARNLGMNKSSGEYIWFVDSDDLICGDFQAVKWVALNEKPDVIAFDASAFNETQDQWNLDHYDRREKLGDMEILSGKEFFGNYYLQNAYRDSACLNLYRREFLSQNRIQFASGLLYEDTEFTFHVYMMADKVKYIPQIYYKRRYRYGSIMTTGINKKKIMDFFSVLKKNTKRIEDHLTDENLKHVLARYLFDLYSVQLGRIEKADVCGKERYFIEAFEFFLKGFQRFISERATLSNINMILTYMNRLEDMTGWQALKHRKYDWKGNNYRWEVLKQEFLQQHMALVSEVLKKLPLSKNILIGIYGTGKHTERMMEAYRRYIGPITANLIFLDSHMPSYTSLFDGFHVLNIKDIPEEMDSIIISSYRYQDEMYQKLKSVKVKANIIRLYVNTEDTFDFFI